MTAFLGVLDAILRELLLFAGVFFLIGALEDLLIDAIWLVRRGWRRIRYYRAGPPMRAGDFPRADHPGLIAVFIPTWREANVIGEMLRHCQAVWVEGATAFRIYVGCYANDLDGLDLLASQHPTIRIVVVPHDGPTTKADCLNHIWAALTADELAQGKKAKAVLLHDSEDLVHPAELRIIDRLIERNAAVQFPVIPEIVPGSRWISGHYCDEFAEAHGKTLVVREAIGAALPLAGVGCAIDRNLLGRIALAQDNRPFDNDCLTEDYELGIGIGANGGKVILARILDTDGQLVGTHAHFPETREASVRQKARWLTGIALAGWDRLGWRGGPAELWMRLHDRRAVLAALVLLAAYICLLLGAILIAGSLAGLHTPPAYSDGLRLLMAVNLAFLCWRLIVRAGFVISLYGWQQGLLSMPRSVIANIIAIMAARRACTAYARYLLGKPLHWDKTEHRLVPTPPSPTGTHQP